MRISLRISLAVAVASALVSSSGFAEEARRSRVGPASTIAAVRANAEVWDFVTIEGRVIKKSDGLFFELEDDTGSMTVRIPEYVTRDLGTPKIDERIRVMGKFDRKTLQSGADRDSKQGSRYWGVRVEKLARNLSDAADTRNLAAPSSEVVSPTPIPSTPAALGEIRFEARPNAGQDLVARMSAGRKRVDAAQKQLEDADAAYAQALRRNESDPTKLASLQQRRRSSEANLQDAIDAIPPLIQEAREAGVAESTLNLYQRAVSR